MEKPPAIELTVKLSNEQELTAKIKALGASLALAESRLQRLQQGVEDLQRHLARMETDPPPRTKRPRK